MLLPVKPVNTSKMWSKSQTESSNLRLTGLAQCMHVKSLAGVERNREFFWALTFSLPNFLSCRLFWVVFHCTAWLSHPCTEQKTVISDPHPFMLHTGVMVQYMTILLPWFLSPNCINPRRAAIFGDPFQFWISSELKKSSRRFGLDYLTHYLP